jgi:hypothetical protein
LVGADTIDFALGLETSSCLPGFYGANLCLGPLNDAVSSMIQTAQAQSAIDLKKLFERA